jgi:hypothetical protein
MPRPWRDKMMEDYVGIGWLKQLDCMRFRQQVDLELVGRSANECGRQYKITYAPKLADEKLRPTDLCHDGVCLS